MKGAGGILIAGELAGFAKRSGVEPVAISVEVVFGKIFVVRDVVMGAEFFGLFPSGGFDFQEIDSDLVIGAGDFVVAEFVEESEGESVVICWVFRLFGQGIINGARGMKAENCVGLKV